MRNCLLSWETLRFILVGRSAKRPVHTQPGKEDHHRGVGAGGPAVALGTMPNTETPRTVRQLPPPIPLRKQVPPSVPPSQPSLQQQPQRQRISRRSSVARMERDEVDEGDVLQYHQQDPLHHAQQPMPLRRRRTLESGERSVSPPMIVSNPLPPPPPSQPPPHSVRQHHQQQQRERERVGVEVGGDGGAQQQLQYDSSSPGSSNPPSRKSSRSRSLASIASGGVDGGAASDKSQSSGHQQFGRKTQVNKTNIA